MWLRVALWSWPVRWLVYSAILAPFLALYVLVGEYPTPRQSERWHSQGAWIAVVAGVLVLGLVMTVGASVRRDKLIRCLDGVAPSAHGQVARAAVRGPVPADPTVRVAAGRLARMQFEGLHPFARIAAWVFVMCALLQIPDFFDSDDPPTLSRVFSLMMFTALAVYWWLFPRVLDARTQLLLIETCGPVPCTGVASEPTPAQFPGQ